MGIVMQLLSEQTLDTIEETIRNGVVDCAFWGDLLLSFDDFDALTSCLKRHITKNGNKVDYYCKHYPHCITTYLVFFAVYSYDVNYWGAIADDLGTPIPQYQQENLGICARKLFDKYNMDYSEE